MGSDRRAPGRPGGAGSTLGSWEKAPRPPLLLVLLLVGCLGRGATAEDAQVNAEVSTALVSSLGLRRGGPGGGGHTRSQELGVGGSREQTLPAFPCARRYS